ncbi:ribonuclease E activity regulator RraA [Aureimonas sp. ME7]|uniref:ribonuclease E activity regulator RraA n=1 Tax=Aureimonas sp. ME7 TaxID=2744252 RepID=UPI0015F403E1|nr:ribonuclease E activity regulator RraA [Aureimonas sp. ME7]
MDDIGTADLCDDRPDDVEVCSSPLRLYGGRRRFHGEIATVRTDGDAGLVKRELASEGRSRVLVVDGAGSLDVALFGDRLAALAVQNGWAGVVVFGAVRDTETLATMDLGVAALGATPRRGRLDAAGAVGASFDYGGVRFSPGRIVVCDMDGLVVTEARKDGG